MSGLSIDRIEILLCVAAGVALLARRARLPYTVGLVFAGALLSLLGVLGSLTLTRDLIFHALLPPLIFEAAFFIRWKDLQRNLTPVFWLATAGVLVSGAIVALLMWWLGKWPVGPAAVFGALIAATDPVSVIAVFKELRVEGRLRLLLEAESLLNDGFAAVAFNVALVAAIGFRSAQLPAIEVLGSTQTPMSVVFGVLLFQVGGGIVFGSLVGGVVLYLAGKTEDHLVELTLTAIGAYGAFLLADHFGASGVFSVLVAGFMIGNIGHFGTITDQGREAVSAFWEFAAFISNSIIFLLIGVRELSLGSRLFEQFEIIGVAVLASLVARAATVYGMSSLFRKGYDAIPMLQQHVLFWGGLKGALSLALVLGLPPNFPYREPVIAATFGVVGFSVVVQGSTMPLLMHRLGFMNRSMAPQESS